MEANPIQSSPEIGELAGALAAAQAEMSNAPKDSKNPHFRSDYASLASVREAAIPVLARHGICVLQMPVAAGHGEVAVLTRFAHKSGQWIESAVSVKPKSPDAQGLGSVVTHLRRYALAAMAGIAQEDDDGEAGVGRPRTAQGAPKGQGPHPRPDELPAVSPGEVERLKGVVMAAETRDGIHAAAKQIQGAYSGPAPQELSALVTRALREVAAADDLGISVQTFREEIKACRRDGVAKPTKAHVRKRIEEAS